MSESQPVVPIVVALTLAGGVGGVVLSRAGGRHYNVLAYGAMGAGVAIALCVVVCAAAWAVVAVLTRIRVRRDFDTRQCIGRQLADWLDLADVSALTDADCLAWRQAVKVGVTPVIAQRWADAGLPYTLIPLAQQMRLNMQDVLDQFHMFREAGVDLSTRRRLGTVLHWADPLDGSFYMFWSLFSRTEVIETTRAAIRDSRFGAEIFVVVDVYYTLAQRHYGDDWPRKVNNGYVTV